MRCELYQVCKYFLDVIISVVEHRDAIMKLSYNFLALCIIT